MKAKAPGAGGSAEELGVHFTATHRQFAVVESWVIEEEVAIRAARESKIARLEALGLRRDPVMTMDEIRRVVAFEAMVDAHYQTLPRHGRDRGVPGPALPPTRQAA